MMFRSWAPVFRDSEISAGQTFFTLLLYRSGVVAGGLLPSDIQQEIPFRKIKEGRGFIRAEKNAGFAQAQPHQARVRGLGRSSSHGAAASGKPVAAGIPGRGSVCAQARQG